MNSSGSLPLFERSCQEVLEKLKGDEGHTAGAMRIEAEELLRVLATWKKDLPPAEARATRVREVMDLYGRMLAYVAHKS